MTFVAADWSITRSNGNIRYIGDDHDGASPSYATVIELHRALQDFADDASASGDDELDITDATPSDRSTDNIITLLKLILMILLLNICMMALLFKMVAMLFTMDCLLLVQVRTFKLFKMAQFYQTTGGTRTQIV